MIHKIPAAWHYLWDGTKQLCVSARQRKQAARLLTRESSLQVKLQYGPKEARGINRAGIWPRHKSSHRGIGQLKASAAMLTEVTRKATEQQEKVGKTLGERAQA